MHKSNALLHPVVSVVGTAEYYLARFLHNLIKPHLPDTYLLKSTSRFIDEVKQSKFNKNQIIISFDAVSLFTNVSLFETIKIIANRLYSQNDPLLNQLPLKKEVFKKLMFCDTQGLFMHKDRLYKQIEGVTMGSPLGPTISNFFLGHLEEKIFDDKSICLPKLYLRYIDDIFAISDNDNDCNEFLKVLNRRVSIEFLNLSQS